MKRRFLSAVVLLCLAGTVVIADEKAPATQPTPINKTCPVMEDEPINPKITVTHEGKTVGLCCKQCIRKFKGDPDKYLAKAEKQQEE